LRLIFSLRCDLQHIHNGAIKPSQRESIKKMSTSRLRTKLAEKGFDTKQLTEMTREQLLDTWAKVVFSMKDVPPMAVGLATKVPTVGYDLELEKCDWNLR